MANAAAEHTQLFLKVNRIVHMGLQHHRFLAVPSAAARALSPALVPRRMGLRWDWLPPAGAAIFYPQLCCLQLIGLLTFVPGLHHKKFG